MARPFRKSVGVIGLGIIGRRIADHLRHQGFSVFVWNRSPRAVPSFVGSPAELAQMCNYLQVFVGDDEALLQVMRSVAPGLTPQHIVIVHSTVSPDSIAEAATIVTRRRARLVEAPFTGSKQAAENGQLVYYLAGDEAARQEVLPLLRASSREIVNVGELGQASVMKVATNIVTAASVQAAAEAMALVQRAGIPLERFVDALKENASKSGTLDLKVPRMISGDFETHFSLKHMLKDMQIANLMAHKFEIDLGIATAARDLLLDQMRKGHGDEDYCAIAQRFLTARTAETSAEAAAVDASATLDEPAKIEQPQISALPEAVAESVNTTETLDAPVRIEALMELFRSGSVKAEFVREEPATNDQVHEEPVSDVPVKEAEATKEEPAIELLTPVAVRLEPPAPPAEPVPTQPDPAPVAEKMLPTQPVAREDADFIERQLARLAAGMPVDSAEPPPANGTAANGVDVSEAHTNSADRRQAVEASSHPAENLDEAADLHAAAMRNGPSSLELPVLTNEQDEDEQPLGILARLLRKTTDY